MAATALRATPLDVRTFRAYGTGKKDNHEELSQVAVRFCKLLTRAMTSLCATPPNFTVERIEVPEAAIMPEADAEAVHAILQQADANAARLIRVSLDKPLVFALCELLLGGLGGEAPYGEQRPISRIESNLGRHLIAMIGEVLPQVLPEGSLSPLSLWQPKADSDEEAPAMAPAIRIRLLATMMSYSGELQIELPAEIVLLAKQAAAAAGPSGTDGNSSSGWERQIATQLEPSEVEMRAILTSFQMTLEDIGKLLPGQLVRLPTSFSKPVALETEGVGVAKARLGQRSGRFCLSVLPADERKV